MSLRAGRIILVRDSDRSNWDLYTLVIMASVQTLLLLRGTTLMFLFEISYSGVAAFFPSLHELRKTEHRVVGFDTFD